MTATVVSPTSPQFSTTNYPPYFGFTTNPLVQITTSGPGTTTDFDGTSSFTEVAGDYRVNFRALFRLHREPHASGLVFFRRNHPQTLTGAFFLLVRNEPRPESARRSSLWLRCPHVSSRFLLSPVSLPFLPLLFWAWLPENSHARQIRSVCFLGSARKSSQLLRRLSGSLPESPRSLWEWSPSLLVAPGKWARKGELKLCPISSLCGIKTRSKATAFWVSYTWQVSSFKGEQCR